jgi:hypothetical protein
MVLDTVMRHLSSKVWLVTLAGAEKPSGEEHFKPKNSWAREIIKINFHIAES